MCTWLFWTCRWRGGGAEGFGGGAIRNGREEVLVAGGAPVDVNTFDFPVVFVSGAHYIDGGLEVVLLREGTVSP